MNASTADTPSLLERLRPLSESPSFWLVVFVNAAIVGLLLIAPKYRQRQSMLERRFEARREIALRQAAGIAPLEPSVATADPHAGDRELLVPLWRLLSGLIGLDVAAISIFVWQRRPKPDSKPTEPSRARI